MKTYLLLVIFFFVFRSYQTYQVFNIDPGLKSLDSDWLLYPLKWPQIKYVFPYKVQSPINILTAKAQPTTLSPLEIHFPWSTSEDMVEIENTGYYLEVSLPHEYKERPYLTGGPLIDSKYVFEQLHFHWGPTDQCGSEHRMDDHCFSTEVHVVYYNKLYGSFAESIHHPDGVAVLAIFGEVSEEHNSDFDYLIHEFSKIIQPETKTNGSFNKEFKFLDILFKQPTYYSFPGSLTTPSYSECVTWIVVPCPFKISPQQLQIFREFKAKNGLNLDDNDRKIQDSSGRPVITPLNKDRFRFTQEITFKQSNDVTFD